jgi:hypothetical protein
MARTVPESCAAEFPSSGTRHTTTPDPASSPTVSHWTVMRPSFPRLATLVAHGVISSVPSAASLRI